MEAAAEAGLGALALCDRDGLYGIPRFHKSARATGLRPLVGAELTLEGGAVLPVLVESREGYRNLSRLLTRGHLAARKGEAFFPLAKVADFTEGLVALTGDAEEGMFTDVNRAAWMGRLEALRRAFPGEGQLQVELNRWQLRGEAGRVRALRDLAESAGLPVVASNAPRHARRQDRVVADLFTCLRHHTHLDAAGRLLSPNAERHLKGPAEVAALFADCPEALRNTQALAERLEFSLEDLGYEFPRYRVPEGETMDGFLRKLTWFGAEQRYGGLTPAVRGQIGHELAVIARLGFSGYFLIVWDIVNFCRESGILVQGRGSAANSAVCYSLGITAVDPVGGGLLFERFLSEGREGWPDIDLDLPSGARRESVIQEVYRRYGKHGAAMTANVITYRGRSAVREIGKVLNFPPALIDRFSSLYASGDYPQTLELEGQLQQAGIRRDHPRAAALAGLYGMVHGLPRHLGQHSGGMIICEGALDRVVPLENASMPGRVVAQWDKDDCEDLGIVKVDLLGLGMMAALQDTIELTRARGHAVDLAHIPKDDPATFECMRKADTVGVFQIESRAQQATLPLMKPACFYDVAIEVAIIRPGPIQGDLVHPYLARRQGKAPVDYLDDRLKPVLERTLGVPLFQEQMLRIAMILADFDAVEADELRRALNFHRSPERLARVQEKMRRAMKGKGVAPATIEAVLKATGSFALYGFPESHAISFALLAYGSTYLKVHYPAEFYCGLLNNQPMGFYSPATLVQDAKRRGLRFRAPCVRESDFGCTVEDDRTIRIGLEWVRGVTATRLREAWEARALSPFASLEDFRRRTAFNADELRRLARAGALNCFTGDRRSALWEVETILPEGLFENTCLSGGLAEGTLSENTGLSERLEIQGNQSGRDACGPSAPDRGRPARPRVTGRAGQAPASRPAAGGAPLPLVAMNLLERIQADYEAVGLTVGRHPMRLFRRALPELRRAADLAREPDGARVEVGGAVICRQRPGTAKGFVFVSLEDETGIANTVLAPDFFERHRLVVIREAFLRIGGRLQNREGVIHVRAETVAPLGCADLPEGASHDFR